MSLAILIPAYNAGRTIGDVLARVQGLGSQDVIVVVDDGSSDNTAEIAQRDPRVHVVRHAKNLGYGSVSVRLYDEARRLGADVTVNVHADGAHFPEDISTVIAPVLRGEADMAIGSRILGILGSSRRVLGSRTLGACLYGPMPASRFFPNLCLSAYQNWCYGTSFHSFHDGFRACARRVLDAVPYHTCSLWYQFDTEFLLTAHRLHVRIAEVGVRTAYLAHPSTSTPRIRYGLRVVAHATRYAIRHRHKFRFAKCIRDGFSKGQSCRSASGG